MDIWTVPHFGYCEASTEPRTYNPDDILKVTLKCVLMASLLGCKSDFVKYISETSFPILVTAEPGHGHQ